MDTNWYKRAESIGFEKIAQPITPGVAQATPLASPTTAPSPETSTNITDIMRSLVGHTGDFFQVVAKMMGVANDAALLPAIKKNLANISSSIPMMTELLKTLNVDVQNLTVDGLHIIGRNLSQMCASDTTQASRILLSLLGESSMSFETKVLQNYGSLGNSASTTSVQQTINKTVQKGM